MMYNTIKSLYKYTTVNKRFLETFSEGKLYIPTISQLNDPFESSVLFSSQNNDNISLSKIYNKIIKDSNNKNDISNINELIFNNYKYDNEYSVLKNDYNNEITSVFYKAAEKIGVLSMSTVYNSLLMWGHYANSHKGICIEFERSDNNEFGNICNCFPVKYSSLLQNIDVSEVDITNPFKKIFEQKSDDWVYEKEWRYIIPNGGVTVKLPAQIKSIYFGIECNVFDKLKIFNMVGSKCKYYQMKKSIYEYCLRPVVIKDKEVNSTTKCND